MRKSIFAAIPLFLAFLAGPGFAKFLHLELGAANYGQEGHTKRALLVTYRANEIQIVNETSFFDSIKERAAPDDETSFRPDVQYYVLFRTLDQLIKRHPFEDIEIHINDIREDWTEFACQKLREYATQKNYSNVTIVSVPGNYFNLNPLELYDSVHLKNTELMYSHSIDGNALTVTDGSRRRMREGLQKLANLSKHGLHFFIIDLDVYFPHEERVQFSMRGNFYQNDTSWQGLSYHLPDGAWRIPETLTHVFFIPAQRASLSK